MSKMNIFYKFIAVAVVFGVAACGKQEKQEKETAEEQVQAAQKAEAPKVEEPKPVVEEKVAEPPAPVQDSHFLSIGINTDNLKAGGLITGYVDLNVPFENPFESKDIMVEMYMNGESNGISVNAPLFFEKGNSEKSTWKLSYRLPKAGKYKYTINVRAKNKNYFSLEYEFNVADGGPSKIFNINKKGFSHFENKAGEKMRAIGGDFPIQLDINSQKALLERLSKSGGNTIRISIEAPCTAFVAEDSDTAKAGWINVAAFNKVEELMDAANNLGIKTILCFASPLSFSESAYQRSYFAKSGLAPSASDFFKNLKAQQKFNTLLQYCALRFGCREDLLMWQVIDGIDRMDIEDLDARMMWLSNANVTLRDADTSGHPILLSAGTSSEMEFIWSGDSCDVLAFDIFDVKDFALSVNSHNKFFSKKYKKAVAVSKFGNTAGALVLPEPSFILMHNTYWAGLFTPSPLLPLSNLGEHNKAASDAEFNAIRNVSAFEKNFNLASADLELLTLHDVAVLSAPKADGNSVITQPAFGDTIVSRESSNDTAELIMEPDGTILKNTLPRIWRKEAIIAIEVNGIPNDKCALSFEIVSIPQEDNFELQMMLNDDPIKPEKISSEGIKKIRKEGGIARAYLNKVVKIPLERGNQKVNIQLVSDGNASMEVANIRLDGVGSNMGIASVKPFAMRDKLTGSTFIWFKRAATDTASFAKYKLYERNIPDLKPFEYSVQMKADTSYRVTWWDTRAADKIAVGVIKSDANASLKLRTPPFKYDVACAIEEIKQN